MQSSYLRYTAQKNMSMYLWHTSIYLSETDVEYNFQQYVSSNNPWKP